MGIVASLAAAPAAYDIIQDERIRDQERLVEEDEHLKKLKDAELYKLGDVELDLIKRLSKEITDVEVNIPNVVKFREGQTKVNDVKKVYLTGQYRQKYKNISESNYTNSPIKSAQFRIYPTLEIGGRKIRSAYPNVRIKNADREPYKHIYTPSIFIPDRLNNEQVMSTANSPRKAITIQNRNNNNNSFISPLKSPTKNSNIIKMNNEAIDSNYRYTHRTE